MRKLDAYALIDTRDRHYAELMSLEKEYQSLAVARLELVKKLRRVGTQITEAYTSYLCACRVVRELSEQYPGMLSAELLVEKVYSLED